LRSFVDSRTASDEREEGHTGPDEQQASVRLVPAAIVSSSLLGAATGKSRPRASDGQQSYEEHGIADASTSETPDTPPIS
jgi:hypothetical protein